MPDRFSPGLSVDALAEASASTIGHYNDHAPWFWEGTRDHDVSQNIQALLSALDGDGPWDILDLGCGPGRDLLDLKARGHRPVGLDGAVRFVEMARAHAGCEVWHQDFLALDLPEARFDGIFANASLFHVPRQALPDTLSRLHGALRPGGVLFSSVPRGPGVEGYNGDRYGVYLELDGWQALFEAAGFRYLDHYYRPPGKPRDQQPWLASTWQRA
jgi:SAM-dependent methyltransferase